MSVSFDPEDYGLEPVQETVPRNWRRQLEADRKQAEEERDQARAELDAFKREAAFANVPTDGAGGIFRRGYPPEAPLTYQAVQAAWAEFIGLAGGDTQRALSGHAQAQAMATGAPPAVTTNLGNDLAVMKAEARMKRNPLDFHHQKARLAQTANENGVEANPLGWKMPGQLVQPG